MTLRKSKQILRAFLRDETAWPTPKLRGLLAWAQDGKLEYFSPCGCLLGVQSSTVPHFSCDDFHYRRAVGEHALQERAFAWLSWEYWDIAKADRERRRRIIPMIRAVLRERERTEIQPTSMKQGIAEQPRFAARDRRPGGIQPERPMKSSGDPRRGQEIHQ